MGSVSDFLEKEFLDHILLVDAGFSPTAQLYVGLSVGDPTDDDTGIDETAGRADTYVRQPISWDTAAGRAIAQAGVLTFPEAGASWGTVTHWFICDHQTNESFGSDVEMYAHGSLNASKAIVAGNTPSVADNEIIVSVTATASGMSNYLANAFLEWAFNAGTLAQPTSLHVALTTVAITDAMTGTTITEVTMDAYLREQCDAWDAAAGPDPMLSDNTSIIDFGVLTNTGQTVEGICLCDAATVGEMLFYDNTVSQAIGDGDSVNIPAGEFDISIGE